MKTIETLLRRARKASGYGSFHQWEPGSDFENDNPNAPFKPALVAGAPWSPELSKRADGWSGELSDWADAVKSARPGHSIDFYVTKVGDELVDNVHVWIKSEREIVWQYCGGKPHTISL